MDASSPARISLPVGLQAVLRLAPPFRHCVMLRILLGLPRHTCASWLNLNPQHMDQYTLAALKTLGGLDPHSAVSLGDSVGV